MTRVCIFLHCGFADSLQFAFLFFQLMNDVTNEHGSGVKNVLAVMLLFNKNKKHIAVE